LKGTLTGFFFPDRAVGIFPPLIPVAVRFPEDGVFREGPVVKSCSGKPRTAGRTRIILGEELAKGEAGDEQDRGQEPDHNFIQEAGRLGVNLGAT